MFRIKQIYLYLLTLNVAFLPFSVTQANFWNPLKIGIGKDGRQYIAGDLKDICDLSIPIGTDIEPKRYHDESFSNLQRSLYLLGNPKIQNFTTKELLKNAGAVKFCRWPALTPMGGTDSRSGAINAEGIVIYNYSVLNWMPKKTVSILLLHELLEASGIYDNNYDLSTLLSAPLILEVLPLKQNKQELWNRLQVLLAYKSQLNVSKEIPRSYPLQLAGGVTGIGSGGDPLVTTFKAYTFAKALTEISKLEDLFTIQSLHVTLDNPLLTLAIGADLRSIEIPNPKSEWIIERLSTYDWFKVIEKPASKEIILNAEHFFIILLTATTHPEFLYNNLANPKKVLEKYNTKATTKKQSVNPIFY